MCKFGKPRSMPAMLLLVLGLWCLCIGKASASVLEECMALSQQDDEIHNCLDNFLDIMDENIADLSAYINRELDGEAQAAFVASQQAFFEYRRLNCEWYLAFSTPRSTGERIAKNCLAEMSQQRLSELQALIARDRPTVSALSGYYVYGAERNSFQPCDSRERYWVEGETTEVSTLQQTYLNQATADLQVLYAQVRGNLDTGMQAPAGHSGVLLLQQVVDVRFPTENDCQLPVTSAPSVTPLAEVSDDAGVADVTDEADGEPATVAEATETDPADDEVQQQLRAYFGDWLADCVQGGGRNSCELSVQMRHADGPAAATGADAPTMTLVRRSDERTTVVMRFPGIEVDSPDKFRWRVDGYSFGDIPGSTVRVDESATRQLLTERRFIRDDLLPLLLKGTQVGVAIDDGGGDFQGTLIGLSRALDFADDFIAGNEGL